MEQKKITLPEGWEVDKIENGEIILKESEKELPKIWEECYLKLDKGEYISRYCDISKVRLTSPEKENRNMLPIGLGKPLLALMQLLICRDVYRNGWKPDWSNNTFKYCIETINSKIACCGYQATQKLLSFQSREVRNKFLENFKDLIEEAKELI